MGIRATGFAASGEIAGYFGRRDLERRRSGRRPARLAGPPSTADRREKVPASIAAMARIKASFGVDESTPVTNWSSLTLSVPPGTMGFPSNRLTLARHLPGSRWRALTKKCLYSTAWRCPAFSQRIWLVLESLPLSNVDLERQCLFEPISC